MVVGIKKFTMEYVVPKIAKNLTKLRKIKDEGFKSVDDQTKGTNVTNQKKSEIKKSFSEKVSKVYPETMAKGGRVGLKRGTGLKRKSNIDKIKKTFGPKKGLGMQSVIYGLDKNPKITAADPIFSGSKLTACRRLRKLLLA